MSNDVVLGIDLGTTNSVVAVSDGGQARVLSNELGHRLVPSVVSFKPGGGVLVGEEARERRLLDASNTVYSVKRLIGRPYRSPEVRTAQERFAFEIRESPTGGVVVGIRGDTYTLTEISAFVLREVARVAELSMGKVSKAVITVPANFNELQRSATKAAGRVAGLDVLRIINEPTAAALAYGYGKDRPERVAVFDLGGGTFDVTILDLENDVFEVISTAGDSFLGGDDVDLLIAEAMCDTFLKQHRWDPRADRQAYERLRAAAEWAKCQLSADDAVELTVEELHYGPGGKPLDLEFEMSRQELERAVQPLLARSFDVCQDAFKEAGMKATDVDSVVLVGGSTRMPLVRSMVTEYFQKEPRDEIDPDLVVAQGAAIHGFAVGGQGRKRRQSLGRVALKKVSSREVARLKQERKSRKDALPKQPAFAPTAQVDKPRPKALATKAKRPAPPPLAPSAKIPGNDQLTRVAAVPAQEGATRVAPSPLTAGTPAGSDDALTRVAAIPDAPPAGQDATRVAGRPPPPPVPKGKKRPSPPRVALTKRKRPKKTQLGVGALPPPVPNRGFDDEEETVRHKDADALIAQAAGPAGPPPVRPKLIPTDGSGAHNFSDHEVTTTADLDVDALMAAGMAEAKEPRGPKVPPVPPQVPAPPPSADIGFDAAPDALPGVVASPVVSVGAAKADHSQVDMQLKDFLREEPSQPFPLRQRVDTQDGAYGAIEDSPTSVRESPYEAAAPAPEAAWEDAGLDGLGLEGAHPPADPFGAPPPVQTAQGHAFDVPPVSGLEGEGFELPSMPPEDPSLNADAFELPSTPPLEQDAPIPAIELGNRPAPLLMDVTPHSLGIETVGGFCQHLLRRNAPIPAEQTRIFSTASDNQEAVTIRVCQGEEKTFSYNQFLGEVHLEGLRKAPRGKVQINVAFQLDASGTLVVRAVDMDTGAEQRIRINLLGGASEEEIEAMRSRQQQMLGA